MTQGIVSPSLLNDLLETLFPIVLLSVGKRVQSIVGILEFSCKINTRLSSIQRVENI